MAELVDAPDLGSGAERREGSSPSRPTNENIQGGRTTSSTQGKYFY